MRAMTPMTLADLDTAPFRFHAGAVFSCTAARLFEELAEPHRWPAWFPLMVHARWTSADTACTGARREVSLLGFGRFEETILTFDPGERFAFTMIASTSPLARQMAEDYRVSQTGRDTRLEWTLAAVPTPLGKLAERALPLVLDAIWKRAVGRLQERLLASRSR